MSDLTYNLRAASSWGSPVVNSMSRHELLMAAADEIDLLNSMVENYESERDFGAATTFCGVPIREAMRIVRNAPVPCPDQD